MIQHPQFIWLHLPRTAGTSTSAWLRHIRSIQNLPILIDPDDVRDKHDNLAIRSIRNGQSMDNKVIAMNFRSLPEWLSSNYAFARKTGLHVPKDRYLKGEFFSLRVGAWCPADWWLSYFNVHQVTHFLSCNQLERDWRQFLWEIAGIVVPSDLHMPRANQINALILENSIDESLWDIARTRNPYWAEMEKKALARQPD